MSFFWYSLKLLSISIPNSVYTLVLFFFYDYGQVMG